MGKVISVALAFKDAFTNPSKKAMDNLNKLGKEVKNTGKQIEKAGSTISSAGSKLTKSVTMPIAGIAAASVKTAADFEASMSNVGAITGATGKDFQDLTKLAQDLGKSTKFSASEVAEAMQYTGMAGWTAKDNIAGLKGILDLSAASGSDLAKTSDIVTDAISAFGNSAKDSGMFADVMTKACTSANVSVDTLGESYKYAAAVCGTMKYSVQDATTALAVMGNNGIKGSTAGNTLKNAISNMAAPTDSMQKVMKKLGISITNNDGSMKSLSAVIKNIRTGFSGLTKDQQAAYAKTLFGKESMAGMLSIIKTSDKEYNNLAKAINNSGGAADKTSKKQLNNLNGQLTLLKSAGEGAAITIGNKLLPFIKKATTFVQTLADKFNSLSDEQVNTILKFAGIAAAVGPAIFAFGKIVSTIGKVHKTFGIVMQTISQFGGIVGIITSPAAIVIAAVAGIAAAAILIRKNWDKIQPTLKKVGNFLKGVFGPAFTEVSNTVKKNMIPIIKKLKKIVNQLKPAFTLVANVTKKVFTTIASFIKKNINTIIKVLSAVVRGFTLPFRQAFAIITSVVGAILDGVSGVISSIKKVIDGLVNFVTGVFSGNWKKAWTGIKDIFSGIFGTYANIVKTPFNAVISIINKAISAINNALGKIKIPKWVPVFGGKKFNFEIPTIPNLSRGTNDWKGGPVQVHERGGEIIDLPKGSRVYPHDESVKMAKQSGKDTNVNVVINIDRVDAHDDSELDKLVDKMATKLKLVYDNM